MIYEFAIDPNLVATWGNPSDYRFFADKFGLGTARVMSEFPKLKNWRRQILKATSGAEDLELQRITALISLLTDKMISRPDTQYDGTISWLENAEFEHTRKKFHAILSTCNPRNHTDVMTGENLGVNSDKRWNLRIEKIVPREASEMSNSIVSMMSNCTIAILIDPHFGPENPRHRRTLTEFLNALMQNRNNLPLIRVEIHTKEKSSAEFFKKECKANLSKCIPMNIRVKLVRWKQRLGGEKLHNRYILTDIGGVKFTIGLDDGQAGETDEITLLPRETYELRWKQYASNEPAFDFVDEIYIPQEDK